MKYSFDDLFEIVDSVLTGKTLVAKQAITIKEGVSKGTYMVKHPFKKGLFFEGVDISTCTGKDFECIPMGGLMIVAILDN